MIFRASSSILSVFVCFIRCIVIVVVYGVSERLGAGRGGGAVLSLGLSQGTQQDSTVVCNTWPPGGDVCPFNLLRRRKQTTPEPEVIGWVRSALKTQHAVYNKGEKK